MPYVVLPYESLPWSTMRYMKLPATCTLMKILNGCPRLNNTCQRLNQSKYNCQQQNHRCNPKGIPLHFFTVITPPLPDGLWLGIVKGLLKNHKTVTPVAKFFNLASGVVQMATTACFGVKIEFSLFSLKPFPCFAIVRREKKRECSERLVYKSRRENIT